jgi:hypothetical protein
LEFASAGLVWCAAKQMNGSHHRSEQAPGMPAQVVFAEGPVLNRDAAFQTTPQERLPVKLLGIIDVDQAG